MAVKLIMTWDIFPEREQEYFEFVVREFMPSVQRLGFELSDAWATSFGDRPQILVGAMFPSQSQVQTMLKSAEWLELRDKLEKYVRNYNQKLVEASGGFQF